MASAQAQEELLCEELFAKFGWDNPSSQTVLCEQSTPTAFYSRVQTLDQTAEGKMLFPAYFCVLVRLCCEG